MACCVAGTRTLKLLLTSRFTAALFAERRLYHSGPVVFPKTLLLSTGTELHQNPFTRRITNLTHGDRYRKGGIGTPNYDVITEPGNVSPMQYVPDSIARPSYAISGIVVGVPKEVEIKTEEQIARMREACKLARMILSRVSKQVKAGVTTDELDSIVASQAGFTVVPAFCGHGIGTYFHGPPDIYHFDNDEKGEMMEGLVFTIEPVITEGSPDIAIMEDGWTTVTVDNSRTAQFEHTVYICNEGAEILTVL